MATGATGTTFTDESVCTFITSSLSLKKTKATLVVIAAILIAGLVVPQRLVIPVKGATSSDWHKNSFWYYPWGKSVTHKGIDIFAREGTDVVSASSGLVVFRGHLSMGGNVIVILGPQWRFYYYAHLKGIYTKDIFVNRGKRIGSTGTTGNARGKAPHLHFTIATMIPYPWRWDRSMDGWKKMFYLDPADYLQEK